jgi:hypothetical protein
MFGYRPAMKVENLLKSFYILATLLGPRCSRNTRFFRIRKKIIGEYFTDFVFWKKKIVTKERRCLDVHSGCLMDGWMDGRKTSS